MKSFDTFGGNTNRGKGFFVLDDDGIHYRIDPSDLTSPEVLFSGSSITAINQGIWGKDSGVLLGYSSQPYVKYIRDPGVTFPDFGKFGYIDSAANPFSADYPFTMSYVNNQFVTICTQATGNPIVIYTSPDGLSWTKITTGPIAEGTQSPGRMSYNPDDGRYAFASRASSTIFYSDDDMATWSTSSPGSGTVFDIEYGNGIWMVSYFSNGYYYSTNNMSTWNSTSAPFNTYNIMFHEPTNRFFVGGGIRQGTDNYDARIAYTTNGSSWTTVHSGTENVYVNSIKGDEDGNMIAIGFSDDGVAFIGTTAYLYSTDNGNNWSAGTFPTTVDVGFPNSLFYADGTVNDVTPLEYSPIPPGNYTLTQTLDNPNAYGTSDEDRFGETVAIDGNYAIVGAFFEDDAGGEDSGKAYIYDVTTGAVVHTLNNPTPRAGDRFAETVAISGDRAIVGAINAGIEDGDEYAGKAYIYNVTTGALVHTLDNPNPETRILYNEFSRSVAISGDRAIVGAPYEDDANGNSSGKAYIFSVTDGSLVHTLDNPNAYGTSFSDQFSRSVAISGDRAIVGAYYEDDAGGTQSGKAYIFDVTSGNLLYTLDNPNAYDTSESDLFGDRVAISGNYAIVVAQQEDDAGGTSSGKAYIYDVTTGNLLHTLDNPNAYAVSQFDFFGSSVAISGDRAIVGARFEDDANGQSSGKAYIFDVTTGELLQTIDNPNAYGTSQFDRFGNSVAISGDRAVVGAAHENDAGGTRSGKAYIFEYNIN